MFDSLTEINRRPKCWEKYTAETLWNDPHISSQMLQFHLDENIDPASRRRSFLDRSAAWIADHFELNSGVRVCDLGCGPGLYTSQFAATGARVVGVDFSERSIRYAREAAARDRLEIEYVNQNYLEFETDNRFDLITMIYCDYCALSPEQRRKLLALCRRHLAEGGSFLLDVFSMAAYDGREETVTYGKNFMGGFWSPDDYFCFLNTIKYGPEKVILDKYTVIEPSHTWEIFNWLQYFSADSLRREFEESGWRVAEQYANVAGDAFDDSAAEIAIVAEAAK